MHCIIFDGDNDAAKAAAGHHFVAGFQIVDHLLPALLPFLLRHNQKKIEDGKNEEQRQPQDEPALSATGLEHE